MPTITKGDLVKQCYVSMRISGLTVDPTPEDMEMGLAVLERMVLSLENKGIFLSYNRSDNYPNPDPSEESGISDKNSQAIILLLFKNLCSAFGKVFPQDLKGEAYTAYQGLFNNEPPVKAQNPYQPAGQGSNRYVGQYAPGRNYMPTEEQLTIRKNGQLEDFEVEND